MITNLQRSITVAAFFGALFIAGCHRSSPPVTPPPVIISPPADTTIHIPSLIWQERSDWVNVKTKNGAVGDGVADDTAAIQAALNNVHDGSVIYFPTGTYRITKTLNLTPASRILGLYVVGSGRDTTISWDGAVGQQMIIDAGGLAYGRWDGMILDGDNKAIVGFQHGNGASDTFETEVGHRDMAFKNFTSAGILAATNPATSEIAIENCVFENCGTGININDFNEYDFTIAGCEFRKCGVGVFCHAGNTYIRDSHFEESAEMDIKFDAPEHGCSVLRCTSTGSKQFLQNQTGVNWVTVQDCHVSGWTGTENGAIKTWGAPAVIFDCVFTNPPDRTPPINIAGRADQVLFVSNNVSTETDAIYTRDDNVYVIPDGTMGGSLTSANQHFLKDTAMIPGKVYDAKTDFGAVGDDKTDDTVAIQNAINAARNHGGGAIAYLPTGKYKITQTLQITGSNYYFGGSGFRTGLNWKGADGGTMVSVTDPQNVTVENINVGSHDVGKMKNAYDIVQASTGDAASSITYDNVTVFGMYDKQPERKGLWLQDLSHASTVLVRHVSGNIHLKDAARAKVLLGISYEGSITVEGKSKQRDGFCGIMSRLGTVTTYPLIVKDNHSLVASDFYIEQADNGISLQGAADDPDGRVTMQIPKLHLSNAKSTAVNIDGYHGQVNLGPVLFYDDPRQMNLRHSGVGALDLLIWGSTFYNTKLATQESGSGMNLTLSGNVAMGSGTAGGAESAPSGATLAQLSLALDDLGKLGEVDLQLNYPGVLNNGI